MRQRLELVAIPYKRRLLSLSNFTMPITPDSDSMRVVDLVSKMGSEIKVNQSYQRSGEIWPARAKSFLVETVLKGMPIPRVLLHTVDEPVPPHRSDIIDGQQRCSILADFRADKFALTADVDDRRLYGKKYTDLSPPRREAFDNYMVPIDRYEGIRERQIRQVFRRLNYYTAPLNAAEQRHAQFYGELSRYVTTEARLWREAFGNLRVFTPKQIRRKADEQLMAELVDAMLRGISTPTEKTLRDIYEEKDREFTSAGNFRNRFAAARAKIETWTYLRRSPLRKHYHMFGLILAVMHSQNSLAALRADLGEPLAMLPRTEIEAALMALDDAVRRKAEIGRYARFWAASAEKTNVRPNRLIRCRFCFMAITGHRYVAAELVAP